MRRIWEGCILYIHIFFPRQTNNPLKKPSVYIYIYPVVDLFPFYMVNLYTQQTTKLGPLFFHWEIRNIYLLVVSTHLKNISQTGNLPQIGVKITNLSNHQPQKHIFPPPNTQSKNTIHTSNFPHTHTHTSASRAFESMKLPSAHGWCGGTTAPWRRTGPRGFSELWTRFGLVGSGRKKRRLYPDAIYV